MALKIEKKIPLKNLTTFKIGGLSDFLARVKTEKDLVEIIEYAKNEKLAYFILGGGSNLLVSSNGWKGLAIKMENKSLKLSGLKIIAEAGCNFSKIVSLSAKNNLSGLEWAAGIPGTVGGAVCGNAGAFGESICKSVEKVRVFDVKKMEFAEISGDKCGFDNKETIFKKNRNLVIVSVVLKLKKGEKKQIGGQIRQNLKYRKDRHPSEPSAGCIYKNCERGIKISKGLEKKYPELLEFSRRKLIPASYLIDKASLKGKKFGDVVISEKHANFIVNVGAGNAENVRKLIDLTKKRVRQKFGIELAEEVRYIGFEKK